MFQINFGQPYTANLLWFSLGLVEGYFLYKGPESQEIASLATGASRTERVHA
jgi:hypothetical protein